MMSNERKLTRSRSDRMLAGVCGGLAQFFGLDTSLVRIAYAILTIFTAFAGVPVYILMWIIIPEEKNRYSND
ncbi:PspC domain-containing protein [Bacteroides sp. K03]|nr:PspC domain-containing protein [Bacteroides sp. K03]